MAKSKYAPALFEVISKKDEKAPGLPVPKWWRSKDTQASPEQAGPDAGVAAPTAPAESAKGQPEASGPAGNGIPPAVAPATSTAPAVTNRVVVASSRPAAASAASRGGQEWDEEPPPMFRMNEGRVELSLNPVNAAIVGGVLVLALFLSYQLGRGFSPSKQLAQANSQGADLESVKEKPANPDALNVKPANGGTERSNQRATAGAGNSTQGTPTPRPRNNPVTPPAGPTGPTTPPTGPTTPPVTPPAAGPVQRTPGLTYVILETFQRDHKGEAEQICQWLKASKNVDTTVEPSGEKWQLVSTKGFEYNTEAGKGECTEYEKMVRSWGQEYKKEFKSKALYDMRSPGRRLQK